MNTESVYEGKWLRCCEKQFTNEQGESKGWEFVSRKGTSGAACVLAIIEEQPRKVVLIKQFRPPLEEYTIEFPAGLIDAGESVEASALRELQEETGYIGEVTESGPFVFSSPGLTDEKVSFVQVKITGKTDSRPESDEDIEVLVLPLEGLLEQLSELEGNKHKIDAKLWFYAHALNFSGSC